MLNHAQSHKEWRQLGSVGRRGGSPNNHMLKDVRKFLVLPVGSMGAPPTRQAGIPQVVGT